MGLAEFDFRRNKIPSQEDKAKLRLELEEQMKHYKGEITVLPPVQFKSTNPHHVSESEEMYHNRDASNNRKLKRWLDGRPNRAQLLAKKVKLTTSQVVNRSNAYCNITNDEMLRICKAMVEIEREERNW